MRPPRQSGAGANPWLIAILVAFASFHGGARHHDRQRGVCPTSRAAWGERVTRASWVVTTYLVSNAIILTASAAILARELLGRKPFFLICLATVHPKLAAVRLCPEL